VFCVSSSTVERAERLRLYHTRAERCYAVAIAKALLGLGLDCNYENRGELKKRHNK